MRSDQGYDDVFTGEDSWMDNRPAGADFLGDEN